MQMLRTPGMELLKIHMLHFTSFVPSTKVHCQCRSIHCLGRCRWSCRDSMYVATLDFNAQVESPRFLLFPSTFCWSWFMIIVMHMHYLHHLDQHLNDFESVFTKKKSTQTPWCMYTSNWPGKYFSGQMDFGGMMEAATVLGALQSAFTTLVTQMGSLAEGEYSRGCRCSLWASILTLLPRDTSGIISIGHASTLHGQVETVFIERVTDWFHLEALVSL